jgi:adenylosuccinate synthase
MIDLIVDLQYGSCGKGLLAGWLAEHNNYDTIVIAWSPNAGHTYINRDGRKFVNTALPNGIVSKNLKKILIGPGSVVNGDQLLDEIARYVDLLDGVDIMIHESAAVVTQEHRDAEAQYAYGIGSTMKGVGEAVISKIRRPRDKNVIARDAFVSTPLEGHVVSAEEYNRALDMSDRVLIEGAQGFSLSINQGFYPFVTSRDCTTHQILSDCAIPRRLVNEGLRVFGACRTYPIRVANRYDKDGNMIGTSGPCYSDQREISWSELGMEPETTTVTKLPRRIFTWSDQQIADAIRMNGVDFVFLNFINYIGMGINPNGRRLDDYLDSIEGNNVKGLMLGRGPTFDDVAVYDRLMGAML